MWYSSVTVWLSALADKCDGNGPLVQVTERIRAHNHWRGNGSEPVSRGRAACEGQDLLSTHRHAGGKRCAPSPGKGPGRFMSEDSTVMEAGMGMNARQSLRCWKVQGLSHGGWSPLPLGPALDHLWSFLGWPGSCTVPQLGCWADEGGSFTMHVGYQQPVSLDSLLSE